MTSLFFLPPGGPVRRRNDLPPGHGFNSGSPQAQSLVHWWPCSFGRSGLPRLWDNTGRTHLDDGRVSPPDFIVDPDMGRAWDFLASGSEGFEKADIAPFYPNADGPWTLAAWFKLSGVTDQTLISMTDNAVGNRYVQMRVNNGVDLQGIIRNTTFNSVDAVASISANVLHHACVTYTRNGGSFDIEVYVDGVSKATGTKGASTFTQLDTLGVGVLADNTPGDFMNGPIRDARILNAKLSGTQVYDLYSNPFDLYPQRRLLFPAVNAPAVGGNIPLFMHHYKQMRGA